MSSVGWGKTQPKGSRKKKLTQSRKDAKVRTKKECKFWVGQPSLFDEVRLRQKLLDKLFETEGSSFSTDFSSKMT